MSEQQPGQGLFTIAEAASIWGISRQAVYKRLSTLDNHGFTGLHGGKRYITRQGIEAFKEVDNREGEFVNQHDNQAGQVDNQVDKLTKQVDTLKEQMQAAESRALSLQATVDAQRAHIDSLQAALDKTQTALNQEQTLHLATMQQRLPGPRKGFMEWLRGGKKEGQNGR